MRVYVLLFNANTDNEGIHSLSLEGRNIVLLFEDEDDATRYALLLEAQDFLSPAVESIDRQEVEDFCTEVGYEIRFIPRGFVPQSDFDRLLLAPPENSLEQTDWQEGETAVNPPASVRAEEDEPEEFSEDELEALRRRFEGLL